MRMYQLSSGEYKPSVPPMMNVASDIEHASDFNVDLVPYALKQHLQEAQVKNPRYSIRSMAKRIGISHSFLIRIFQGKRQLSERMAWRLHLWLKSKEKKVGTTL